MCLSRQQSIGYLIIVRLIFDSPINGSNDGYSQNLSVCSFYLPKVDLQTTSTFWTLLVPPFLCMLAWMKWIRRLWLLPSLNLPSLNAWVKGWKCKCHFSLFTLQTLSCHVSRQTCNCWPNASKNSLSSISLNEHPTHIQAKGELIEKSIYRDAQSRVRLIHSQA